MDMSALNELHDKSMEFAALALREQRYGNHDKARHLFRKALENECAAIDALTEYIEPTYSVLHRSAATLTLDCNDLHKAEQLAGQGIGQGAA